MSSVVTRHHLLLDTWRHLQTLLKQCSLFLNEEINHEARMFVYQEQEKIYSFKAFCHFVIKIYGVNRGHKDKSCTIHQIPFIYKLCCKDSLDTILTLATVSNIGIKTNFINPICAEGFVTLSLSMNGATGNPSLFSLSD